MPMDPKKGIGENIREFHRGKTYSRTKAKHGKRVADRQAVAAAYSNARRHKKKKARTSWARRKKTRSRTRSR